jgi:hypothetical protein
VELLGKELSYGGLVVFIFLTDELELLGGI